MSYLEHFTLYGCPSRLKRPPVASRRLADHFMKSLTIHTETLAGTSFEEAFRDMLALADQLDCFIASSFNGEKVFTMPADSWEKFEERRKFLNPRQPTPTGDK